MEAVIPTDHPLARKSVLTAADLAGQPVVGMWPHQFWRRQVDEFFRSGGVVPYYAVESTSSLMGCQMARDGAGIAIIDRISVRAIDPGGLVIRPLDPPHWLMYGYIYQRGQVLSENAQAFLDCVRRYIKQFRHESKANRNSVLPHWSK
jgi:DNA-binding transcriptional LysR family regulator